MASHGGKMKSMSINGVKIYTISSQQRSVAAWLNPKKRRALRKDKSYRESVELIQDLRFETATTKIKFTPDGEFLVAAGIYPPQVKVYELREFSMKFERHLDAEIVDFEVLSDDYSKMAFLCADRSVNLHARYGKHYSLRIPRMGRDITYDCWSCDLLCAASCPDLYRINLEQGRFLSSFNTQSPALNVVSRSKLHGLVACGGDDGAVECFDMRMKSSVGRIKAVSHANDIDEEVTALEFDDNGGYIIGVGSNAGKVFLYDLRSSQPLRVKDHMYGSPILDIKWHNTLNLDRPKLITTDCHVVKIWDPETGEAMTSIEPTAGTINDICVFNGSGLMLLALDSSQIPAYYLPALGPVPKWCASLEGLTEELEEGGQTSIYDNYKFLTKEELERLNMTSLIGTNVLRAYMHGFFVDYRLYKKAVAMANPFAYEEYKEKQKQEKMDKLFGSRITMARKLPKVKVNQELAQSIIQNGEGEEERKDMDGQETKKKSKKRKAVLSEDVFKDERFSSLFQKEDFQIDKTSKEYLALHPMDSEKQQSLLKEHFEEVSDTDDQVSGDSDLALESSEGLSDADRSAKRNISKGLRLFEVKDERHAEAYFKSVSLAKEESLPLEERVKALERSNQVSGMSDKVKFGLGGSRELSFFPKSRGNSRGKYVQAEDEDDEAPRAKRRGIHSLKLKSDRSWSGGRGRGGGRGGRGRGQKRPKVETSVCFPR